MKKLILSLFVMILITGSVLAVNDVAYITRGTTYIDNNLVNAIQELGYSVDFIDDSNIPSTNFSEYMMMLVPDQNLRDYIDDIPVNEVNALVLNTYYMDEWEWVYGGTSQTASSQPLDANVISQTMRITQGIPGNFQVYTQAKDGNIGIPMYYLPKYKRATGLKGAVSTQGDELDFVIAKAEKGTKLRNSEVSDSRTVFFGITETKFWTADSKKLFKNSVEWIIEGDDFDQDGFFTDEDCNDFNASLWQTFKGYPDNDYDSYGAGSEMDVCSGSTLLSGYSVNDLDCDDSNSSINPDATEVIYDGVDNDCKNGDLDDLDMDGFKVDCSLITGIPCLVVGGTDCKDSDSSYNIDSTDSTKNCINEAPVFSGPIENITWDEDKGSNLMDLKFYFSDPDGDKLEFNISSTSENENVTAVFYGNGWLKFQSSDDWNGKDWVMFYASDGEINTTTNNITLTVNPVNDAPVIDDIPEVVANETDLIEFNVSSTDIDFNETLDYYATNLPEGATFIDRLFSWLPDYFQAGIYKILFNVTDGDEWDEKEVTINVNNVNRAPVLEFIENQFTEEDTQMEIQINASDPDNETLTYSIIKENKSEVNCAINNDKIKLIPDDDWNGIAVCEVEVSDGDLTANQLFNITVNPVNDGPVLEKINDITAYEGDLIGILAVAEDVDNDSLTYSLNDSRFEDSGNGNFLWQTNYTDSGTYYVNVSVSDGNLTDFQTVSISVKNKNQPPVVNTISNITIEEDSGSYFSDEKLSADDFDGYVTKFEVSDENLDEVDCKVSNKDLVVTPAKDFQGVAKCVIRAYDNEGDYGEGTVNIIVTNINDAPEIVSYNPKSLNPLITEDGDVNFELVWKDIDDTDVDVEWYRNGEKIWVGEDYLFEGDGSVGEYHIKVVVTDGEFNDSVEWALTTTDIPVADSYDGNTTDFSGMSEVDLSSVDLVLEKTGFGKIEFLEPVDLRDVADLDSYTDIRNGLCSIDSNFYNMFKGKDARITFYNLNFPKTPTVYYNSGFTLNPASITQICSDSVCSTINYDGDKLSFVVNGFSSFMAGDTLTCEQQSGFICSENEVCKSSFIEARDSNACCPEECTPYFSDAEICEITNNNITVTLKDPDNGDEFKPGDTIDVDVKIENSFDEKHDFDVKAYLYDLKDGKYVDDDKDSLRVSSGKSERVELSLEIPDDIEDVDKSEFYVYVRAEDEDEGALCNENYVKIELIREDDDAIIKNIEISPMIVSSGDAFDVVVRVENIGADEQEDVYVVIENSELEINQKSEEFDIEEFGGDDSKRLSFVARIPEGVEEKDYDLKATVFFADEDEKDSKSETFSVMKKLDLSGLENSGSSESIILLGSKSTEGEAISLNSAEDPQGNYINLNSENDESQTKDKVNYFVKSAGGALLIFVFLIIVLVVLMAILKD